MNLLLTALHPILILKQWHNLGWPGWIKKQGSKLVMPQQVTIAFCALISGPKSPWLFFLKQKGYVAVFPFFWKEVLVQQLTYLLIGVLWGCIFPLDFHLTVRVLDNATLIFLTSISRQTLCEVLIWHWWILILLWSEQSEQCNMAPVSCWISFLQCSSHLLWPPVVTNKSACSDRFPSSHWAFMRF